MSVFDEVFKNYDIRGLFPQQVNEDFAYKVARAFVSFLKCKKLAVGRDCRKGNEELFNGFSKGLVDQGCEVIDLGQISTDMIYFAVGSLNLDGGCMITASHNPKEWNGFKFVGKAASGISSDNGLLEIKALAEKGEFEEPAKKGKVIEKNILHAYANKVLSFVDVSKIKPLNIVIDASNGMASKAVNNVEQGLPVKISKMFFDLDGNFPNHAPNPLDGNALQELKNRILKEKADLGAIFDGDGDRMFMVDEKGNTVNGSDLTCLIASSFLKKHSGAKILYTPVMSKVVKETIEANGGIPILEKVGHTFIKVKMRKENALFGGELSGHFYFKDNYFADSGIIALVVALEVISESGKTLSELIEPFRKYFSINEINSDVKDKQGKIAELKKLYAGKAKSTSEIDGFTADFGNWWFNVRPSGTEDKLRLNLEANSSELRDEKEKELLKTIRS